MLTYEQQEMQGTEAIINFLANPESGSGISRFETKTAITTFDVQPCGADQSSLCVYVTGNIMVRQSPPFPDTPVLSHERCVS